MAYTKLFNSIITSTIWMEDDRTRIVWITMLACADKNGEVQASIPGLARIAGVPIDDCRAAISKFLSPDLDSRTKDDQGRRIEEMQGGWSLLNFRKYREMASKEESQAKESDRKARYREGLRRNAKAECPAIVPIVPCVSTVYQHIAEAEADTEADTDSKAKASTKAKTTARPLTSRRNLSAEFEHPRFDVPTSWHLRRVKDISEGEAGMTAFYQWLSARVDRTNEDTIVAGVEHGRFVWLDRCFADWMLSTRKAPARLDTFAESQKRRQEELEANYDPRFEGLTMREKVELAKRLQAEEAEQVP